MEKNNIPALNVDEIMEKIREELSRKKAETDRKDITQVSETKLWFLLKKC